MFPGDKSIQEKLAARERQGALRRLYVSDKAIDFSSNDYLGFARSVVFAGMVDKHLKQQVPKNGSTGSRLLAGNSTVAEYLEQFLAKKHNAEAALVFNSGYDANVGLLSSVPQKEDTILYDELVHASIHDGIRLSKADSFMFRHNDLTHLEERLSIAKGNVFVVVESIYSMDGDSSPLKQMAELCDANKANLIVDEAHATGVFGLGLVQQLSLEEKIFARVHTYGKAMGCHGAVVLGNSVLKQYLVNYARSFIYTTALPMHSLISIRCAYEMLENGTGEVTKLHENIKYFKKKVKPDSSWIDSDSAIQSLVVPGNEEVRKLALAIQAHDMDVRPIMSPTVPKGKERIRICLHSYNTIEEIDQLLDIIEKETK